MVREFRIDLLRCEESGALVATSEDIPGLVLEAETVGGILDALMEVAPQLIRCNLETRPGDGYQFTVTSKRPVPLRRFTIEPIFAEAA